MQAFFQEQGSACTYHTFSTAEDLQARLRRPRSRASHVVPFQSGSTRGIIQIDTPRCALPVASLQSFFDSGEAGAEPLHVDYIHGAASLERLATDGVGVGFRLPGMSKHDLFRSIVLDGTLPRKTFSMGEADEKRYYLECRRIVP
jgi:hypothetical protein